MHRLHVGLPQEVSKLWDSHGSVEDYCAGKTDILLKFLDELFCDVKDAVENKTSSYVFLTFRYLVLNL